MNFFEGKLRKEKGLYFEEREGSIRLEIPAEFEKKLSGTIGKEIYLGIRPEHVQIGGRKKGKLDSTWPLRLDISGPMGNEAYLYFQSRTNQIVARITEPVDPKPGAELKMYFDTTKTYFFSKENEASLI